MGKGGSAKTNPQVVAWCGEEGYDGGVIVILEPDRLYHSSSMVDFPANTRDKQCVVTLRFRSKVTTVLGVLLCLTPAKSHVKRELHDMQRGL